LLSSAPRATPTRRPMLGIFPCGATLPSSSSPDPHPLQLPPSLFPTQSWLLFTAHLQPLPLFITTHPLTSRLPLVCPTAITPPATQPCTTHTHTVPDNQQFIIQHACQCNEVGRQSPIRFSSRGHGRSQDHQGRVGKYSHARKG